MHFGAISLAVPLTLGVNGPLAIRPNCTTLDNIISFINIDYLLCFYYFTGTARTNKISRGGKRMRYYTRHVKIQTKPNGNTQKRKLSTVKFNIISTFILSIQMNQVKYFYANSTKTNIVLGKL